MSERRGSPGSRVQEPVSGAREILASRAAALARTPRAPVRHESWPAVGFRLGGELYALEASCVVEVTPLLDLAPVPTSAAPLYGFTLWRGTVLTILDPREALGVQVRGLADLRQILVIDTPQKPVGVLAETSQGMLDLDRGGLRELPRDRHRKPDLLAGVVGEVLVIEAQAFLRWAAPPAADQGTDR